MFAPKRLIPMRIAPELQNNVGVRLGVGERVRVVFGTGFGDLAGKRLVDFDRTLGEFPILRMHQRHVQELPFDRPKLAVLSRLGSPQYDRLGATVPGVGAGAAAVHTPSKLVENDDQGEGAPGRSGPLPKSARAGGLYEVSKKVSNLPIHFVSTHPPELLAVPGEIDRTTEFPKPILKNVFGRFHRLSVLFLRAEESSVRCMRISYSRPHHEGGFAAHGEAMNSHAKAHFCPLAGRYARVLGALTVAFGLVACGDSQDVAGPGTELFLLTAGDECNATFQCVSRFGAEATDCRNSRAPNSTCWCGSQACSDALPEESPPEPKPDECDSTRECRSRFGAAATDCRDSRSEESVCICGSAPCEAAVEPEPEPEPEGQGTLFVDGSSGSDTDRGDSAGAAFRTISKAVQSAEPGDVIDIAAGVYPGFAVTRSGQPGAPITLRRSPSSPMGSVVIDGAAGKAHGGRGLVQVEGQSHIVLDGLRVIDSAKANAVDGILVLGRRGSSRSRDITVRNCIIDKTSNAGIYAAGIVMGGTPGVGEYYLESILIENNEVSRTNWPSDGRGNEAITVGGGLDGFVIRGNYVHTTPQYGIDAKLGAINGEIYNNYIEDIEKHGIYIDSAALRAANIVVRNNVIVNVDANGITLAREDARENVTGDPNSQELESIRVVDNWVVWDPSRPREYATGNGPNHGILLYRHAKDDDNEGIARDIVIDGNTLVNMPNIGIKLTGLTMVTQLRARNNVIWNATRPWVVDGSIASKSSNDTQLSEQIQDTQPGPQPSLVTGPVN